MKPLTKKLPLLLPLLVLCIYGAWIGNAELVLGTTVANWALALYLKLTTEEPIESK